MDVPESPDTADAEAGVRNLDTAKGCRWLVTVLTGASVASVRQGRGTIVNVASMYGLIGSSPHIPATAYVGAKHGVYESISQKSRC